MSLKLPIYTIRHCPRCTARALHLGNGVHQCKACGLTFTVSYATTGEAEKNKTKEKS